MTKYNKNPSVVDLCQEHPKGERYDLRRRTTDTARKSFSNLSGPLGRQAQRMADCSKHLTFSKSKRLDKNGEVVGAKWTLAHAKFCRVRSCPVCQWRRSVMWSSKLAKAIPIISEQYPNGRWLLLTLTVRNCEMEDLRPEIQKIFKGWSALTKTKAFHDVLGFIRSLEVTRGDDGSCHPHIHALLYVRPGYFKGQKYIKTTSWVQYWKKACKLNYEPVCDVRTVKPKEGSIAGAVCEVVKYQTKPDVIEKHPDWYTKFTIALQKTRNIAAGGLIKDCLLIAEKTYKAEMNLDEDEEPDSVQLSFDWFEDRKKYSRLNITDPVGDGFQGKATPSFGSRHSKKV